MAILIPDSLPSVHHRALAWFVENAGKTVGWPMQLEDGTLLANRAKGIYKPAWTQYALSAKQTINSPYADREPTYTDANSWSYLYYQEEQLGKSAEELSSNRAMQQCMIDGVPIGVMRQLSPKPNVRYTVLGLAKIIGKAAGYYLLEGGSSALADTHDAAEHTVLLYPFDDTSLGIREIADMRLRRVRTIVQRQGQQKFRAQLMQLYENKCAISGCNLTDVLEAAHITPYRGAHTNDVSNGVLLRADLHILWDGETVK